MEKRKTKMRPGARKEISAMAWIQDADGHVLLVRQARGTKLWTLPGGKIGASESLIDGLKREVYEETNLRISTAELMELFDRPERRNLTLLYRGIVGANQKAVPRPREISALKFADKIPRDATPSLRHFWRAHWRQH